MRCEKASWGQLGAGKTGARFLFDSSQDRNAAAENTLSVFFRLTRLDGFRCDGCQFDQLHFVSNRELEMRVSSLFPPVLKFMAFAGLLLVSIAPSLAQTSQAEAEFFKGYYLQHERNDLKKAVKSYKRSISLNANAATRAAVDQEMAAIQEELATSDFAKIMPPEAVGYLEISNPGNHVEQIARLMGLTGREFSDGDEVAVLQIDREFAISSDFQISPALLREIKKIRGAAVTFTGINEQGPPQGVLVIHPGQSDLVTGIVETGIQLVPTSEKIGGFPTFRVENAVWIVKTERMIIASADKSQIEDCLERVSDPQKPSLANESAFREARANSKDAAVFGYLSPSLAMDQLDSQMKREIAMARMILDLDHVNHVTATLTSSEEGLLTKVEVDFAEDHNSFGYGLVRTVPLSGKALAHVPAGSVAVVGMGLNPKMMMAAEVAGSRHLTALDIGREIFANIEEVGMFVMPSSSMSNGPVPDFGLVVASSDIEKSQSLWNTLLSIPSKMNMEDGPQAKEVEIEGIKAHHYSLPGEEGVPQIVIARLNDQALIAGTESAVRSAIVAGKSGKTLAKDAKAKALWNAKSKHTAKAAFVHVGRALRLAAQLERGRGGQEMQFISQVVDDLTVTLVLDEAPANFQAKLNATGLPLFEDVIKTLAKFDRQRSPSQQAISASETVIEVRADRE